MVRDMVRGEVRGVVRDMVRGEVKGDVRGDVRKRSYGGDSDGTGNRCAGRVVRGREGERCGAEEENS